MPGLARPQTPGRAICSGSSASRRPRFHPRRTQTLWAIADKLLPSHRPASFPVLLLCCTCKSPRGNHPNTYFPRSHAPVKLCQGKSRLCAKRGSPSHQATALRFVPIGKVLSPLPPPMPQGPTLSSAPPLGPTPMLASICLEREGASSPSSYTEKPSCRQSLRPSPPPTMSVAWGHHTSFYPRADGPIYLSSLLPT